MSQSPNLQTEVRTGWNRINLYWFIDLLTRETQVISYHVLIVTLRLLPFFFRKYRPSSYPCLHIKFITCVQRKQELLIMYVGHSCWDTSLTMCDVIKWPYHGVWREQCSGDSVQVGESELDAGVGESELMYVGGRVSGTDVALSTERRHGDGVLQLVLRQVVWDSSVNVSLKEKKKVPLAIKVTYM